MLGGMLGTAARLGVGLVVPDAGGIPLSTLAVNVLGALLIGVLAARIPAGSTGRSAHARLFLGTGALGGFTTYSAFAVGTVEVAGSAWLAVAYAALTLVLGITATVLGLRLGRRRAR